MFAVIFPVIGGWHVHSLWETQAGALFCAYLLVDRYRPLVSVHRRQIRAGELTWVPVQCWEYLPHEPSATPGAGAK